MDSRIRLSASLALDTLASLAAASCSISVEFNKYSSKRCFSPTLYWFIWFSSKPFANLCSDGFHAIQYDRFLHRSLKHKDESSANRSIPLCVSTVPSDSNFVCQRNGHRSANLNTQCPMCQSWFSYSYNVYVVNPVSTQIGLVAQRLIG